MKRNIVIFLVTLFTLSCSVTMAQSISNLKSAQDFYDIQARYKGPIKNLTRISDIEGSPYLNDKYLPGKIVTTGKIAYVGILLRYNIYSDNFEFKVPGKEALEVSNPSSIKEVIMPDGEFLYLPYINTMNTRSFGFLKKLNDGNAKVLIHYMVHYIPAKEPGAYQQPEPPRFAGNQKFFFLYFGNKPAVRVTNKKELLEALPAHRQAIEKYMRKEKIKPRKQGDLVKLMNYYNSL